MKLTFIHHSSYLVELEQVVLLFDYYGEGVLPPIDPAKPLIVLATHAHHDHYHPMIFSLSHPCSIIYVLHETMQSVVMNENAQRQELHYLATEEELHLDALGITIRAYGSTDLGGSFYVESRQGERCFHAGDLNCWHWRDEASPEYVAQYVEAYETELVRFRRLPISPDLVMYPTDLRLGEGYLEGLELFLEIVPSRYIAPMHLNGTVSDLSALEALAGRYHSTLLMPHTDGVTYLL